MATVSDHAEVVDDLARLSPDGRFAAEHGHGVKVALQRNRIAQTLTHLVQVGCPVEPNGITAAIGYVFYPLSAALGEDNDRYRLPIVMADQALNDFFRIGQRKFLEQSVGQDTAPTEIGRAPCRDRVCPYD